MRCALHWVTLSALFATSGCATVRQLLRLDDPAGAEPAEIPTAPLLGFDRIMQAPGEPDGRFEHVSLLVPGSPAVQPGDSAVLLDLEGPGVIRRIWITVASPDPHYLRRIALRMHWDGETEPSVHVPLGDFFGNGFERRPYAALPLGVASGGFYSYLPMPFTRRAYIVLENGTGLAIDDLQFDADVQLGAVLADPVATFHAFWSRDPRPDPDRPHLVADLAGAGWFVGTSLNAQGHDGTFSFLQGSGVLRIDGRTLNYAATAAYLNETGTRDAEALAGPFQGVVLRDEEHTRLAAYRWHLPDPISFRRSFRLVLERGRANRETADFATVAYWYQTEPHRPLPPLPGPHERRVPEVLVTPGAIHRDDIEVVGTGGGTVRLVLRIPRPDLYEVVVYPEASPDAVTPTVAIIGSARPGRALDVSPAGVEPGDLLPGVVVDTAAVLGRTLELAVAARGGGIALPAAVHLRPLGPWATKWSVVGPWPVTVPSGMGWSTALDSIWTPELDPDLERSYLLLDGSSLRWRRATALPDGSLRLSDHLASERGAAYLQTFLWSPDERPATLLTETDAALQLWMNWLQVSARRGREQSERFEMPVLLRPGWNRVLVKVATLDGWTLRLRVADPTGNLEWARTPGG